MSLAAQGGAAPLEFVGAAQLRQRLVLSALSGQAVRITKIRADEERPGLREHEASFLRLLDRVCNGTAIRINETGTSLLFRPGFLVGGKGVRHECPPGRSVSYYLEGLACLLPFAKRASAVTLCGVTNEDADTSPDAFRAVTLPLLERFGVKGAELRIVRRGAPPAGGGEVLFSCPVVRELRAADLTGAGLVKRVRGVAYTTRVSPQMANRMVDAARGVLNRYLPDVYIYTDHFKGRDSGLSPGYAVSLVAESTTGALLSAQQTADGSRSPEELGEAAALLLLDEIAAGGCVDSCHQSLALLLMALCPEDVSRAVFGKLTPFTVEFLRLLRQMLGVTFKIRPADGGAVHLSCVGAGFQNFSRRTI